jgi:hypothetical protein
MMFAHTHWRVLLKHFAVVAAIAVIAISLFPAAHGPYSATHGPATTFVAWRSALLLLFSIVCSLQSLADRRTFARAGSAPLTVYSDLKQGRATLALTCALIC